MTLYTQKASNIRKTWLLIFLFMVFVIALGWIFSYALNSSLILYIAVIVSFLMAFSSYWWSDKIVTKIARARQVNPKDNPELQRILENLCIAAGLPKPKLYLVPEAQPNAFATGRGPNHAAIAVTQGLIDKLDRSEIEGVLSHELSHIGNRDMLLMTSVVVLAGFIALASQWFLRIQFWGGGRRRDNNNGQAQAIIMAIALAMAILAPLAATIIRLAISRKREFLADETGALITRYPEGLAKALEKISKDENMMRSATTATAHLYIANPFRGKQKTSFFTKMFMTHPPIQERIKRLREIEV